MLYYRGWLFVSDGLAILVHLSVTVFKVSLDISSLLELSNLLSIGLAYGSIKECLHQSHAFFFTEGVYV